MKACVVSLLKKILWIAIDLFWCSYSLIKYDGRLMIGKHCRISPKSINIQNDGIIEIGDEVAINKTARIFALDGGKIVIGDGSSVGRNCTIDSVYNISIGKNVMIAPNVSIFDADHKYSRENIQKNNFIKTEVIIEDGSWIGCGSIILRGTKIGKCSIVGAGTTVKGKYDDNFIITNYKEIILKEIEEN